MILQSIVLAVIHFAWIGIVIGILAAIILKLMKTSNPEIRYRVTLSLFVLLFLLPFLLAVTFYVHSLESTGEVTGLTFSAIENSRSADAQAESTPALAGSWFQQIFLGIWLVGIVPGLIRLIRGNRKLTQLVANSKPVNWSDLESKLESWRKKLGIAKRCQIRGSALLGSPIVIGIIRPTIVFPLAALSGMSFRELEFALIHELIHVRRLDNLVVYFQRVAETLFYFQPAIWYLSRRISLERELCCDRDVVRMTGQPKEYASSLLAFIDYSTETELAASFTSANLVTRIEHILTAPDQEKRFEELKQSNKSISSMILKLPLGLGCLTALLACSCILIGQESRVGSLQENSATKSNNNTRTDIARIIYADDDRDAIGTSFREIYRGKVLSDPEKVRQMADQLSIRPAFSSVDKNIREVRLTLFRNGKSTRDEFGAYAYRISDPEKAIELTKALRKEYNTGTQHAAGFATVIGDWVIDVWADPSQVANPEFKRFSKRISQRLHSKSTKRIRR